MSAVQAVAVHSGGTEREFVPDGDGTWLLTIRGPFGETPGGRWPANEVATHVVDAIYDRQTESPDT